MRAPPPRFDVDEWIAHLAKKGGEGGLEAVELWRGDVDELPAFWRFREFAHGIDIPPPTKLPEEEIQLFVFRDFIGTLDYLHKKRKLTAVPPWSLPRDIWATALLGGLFCWLIGGVVSSSTSSYASLLCATSTMHDPSTVAMFPRCNHPQR